MANEVCAEKLALLSRYEETTRLYSEAVSELNARIGTTSKIYFERLRGAAERAENRTRAAKEDLEKHIRGHGC